MRPPLDPTPALYVLSAASSFALAAGALARRRTDRLGGPAGLFACVAGLWSVFAAVSSGQAVLGIDDGLARRLCHVGWLGVPAGYRMLAALDPGRAFWPRIAARLSGAAVAALLVVAVLYGQIDGATSPPLSWASGPAPWAAVLELVVAGLFAPLPLGLALALRRTRGLRQARAGYLLVAALLYGGGLLLGGARPPSPGLSVEPALGALAGLGGAVVAVWPVLRPRLPPPRAVVARLLSSVVVGVASAGVYLALAGALAQALGHRAAAAVSAAAVLTLALATPLAALLTARFRALLMPAALRRRAALSDAASEVVARLELDATLGQLVDALSRHLEPTSVAILLADPDGRYRLRGRSGDASSQDRRVIPPRGVLALVEAEGRTAVREEQLLGSSEQEVAELWQPLAGLPGALVAPMRWGETPVGVIALGPRVDGGHFTPDQVAGIESLAAWAAVAVRNGRLYEEAVRDSLTRLFNKRQLRTRLLTEIRRATRYGRPLSLMLIDIDRFARVNAEHGHVVGDQVLQQVSDVLVRNLRSVDVIGRWGGEEFAALLPETHVQSAVIAAERVCAAMRKEAFVIGEPVTVSVGLAGHVASRDVQADAADLLARAEAAVGRAKAAGRDQVIVDEVTPDPSPRPAFGPGAR